MIPKGSLENIYFALMLSRIYWLACIYSCSLSLLNMYFSFLMSHQTNMIFIHVLCSNGKFLKTKLKGVNV